MKSQFKGKNEIGFMLDRLIKPNNWSKTFSRQKFFFINDLKHKTIERLHVNHTLTLLIGIRKFKPYDSITRVSKTTKHTMAAFSKSVI